MSDSIIGLDKTGKNRNTVIVNDDGTFSTKSIAGANSNFPLEVGKGNVEGTAGFFTSGESNTINGTLSTIWNVGGRYPILSGNTTVEILSDSTDDDIVGTGAQQILVSGLKLEADLVTRTSLTEVVDMDGTTPVELSNQFFRINQISTFSAGSSNSAQGIINIRNKGTPSEILGRIVNEDNISRQMFYSAPSNQTFFAATFFVSTGKDDEISIKSFLYTNSGIPIVSSFTNTYQNILNFKNAILFNIGSGVDFELAAIKPDGTTGGRTAMFIENFVVDNDTL